MMFKEMKAEACNYPKLEAGLLLIKQPHGLLHKTPDE